MLRELLDKLPVEPEAHGFVRGRSTVTNAELRVDTAFWSPWATLQNVTLSVAGGAVDAVDWVNDVGVAQGPFTPKPLSPRAPATTSTPAFAWAGCWGWTIR